MKNEKVGRELIRKKQLELLSRGIEVYQRQLIDDYVPRNEIILEQIESLKELRNKYPKLSRAINEDLSILLTNHNYVTIKQFNEQNVIIRNDTEQQMINYLYLVSVFENCELSQKQKQMIYDYYAGRVYSDKNLKNAFSKIRKFLEREGMSKELMNSENLKRLFPRHYSKSEDYFNEYLNYSKKLNIYEESVEQSKIEGDRIRALSLSYSILPLSLELDKE